MAKTKKTSIAGTGFVDKMKNMTDTSLLLTITIVVFFVMYIGAIIFLGEGFLKFTFGYFFPSPFASLANLRGTALPLISLWPYLQHCGHKPWALWNYL